MNFHQYFKDLSNLEARFVQLLPNRIIDLHTFEENDLNYEPTGMLVKRNERIDMRRIRSQ